MAQFSSQGLSHAFTGALAKSNLPAMFMRQVQPSGNIGHDAAYFGGFSEFEAQRSKIHGGYQLSRKGHYAEPRMDVNKKTRLRVNADSRPEIAGAFRAARKSIGLSQEELACVIGGSQDAISRWERGIDSPPVSALIALTEMLPEEERAWWREQTGQHSAKKVTEDGEQNVRLVPLLRDAIAAGSGRIVDEQEVVAQIPFLSQWLPKGGSLYALKVRGESMAPIINDGNVVIVNIRQRDPAKLVERMVCAREGDFVTVKWLRRDGNTYLLVPQHTSPAYPVRIMRRVGDFSIVGEVVKWIGYPPLARK
jgi:SOS-response transcriptional repressor LexA